MVKKKWMRCAAAIAASMLFVGAAAACGGNQSSSEREDLVLEQSSIQLYVGNEATLRAADGSALKGTFVSTAPEILSVDGQGTVRALAVGSGVVVVRSDSGTAVCTVIVTGEAPVDLTSLKIEGGTEALTAGESVRLEYDKQPLNADNYNSIRWSSSDPEVASVDADGVLTAISPGRATITLTATGTDFSDSFLLEVAARPNKLTLSCTDAAGLVGTADLTLTADLFTDYKDVTGGTWTTDDPAVATVENGVVHFVGVGKTTVRYSVTAGGEKLEETCAVAAVEMPGYTVIRTPAQLQDIGNTSGYYMLGNDIDLEEACSKGGELYHGGAGFSPLFSDAKNAFSGVFDGMGYAIKNLRIESSNAFTALVSYLSVVEGKAGVIRNLTLEGGSVTGGHYSAALVGRCNTTDGSAEALVENCLISTDVSSFGLAAGIVGFNGGILRDCIFLGSVSGETTAAFALRQCDNADIGIDGCAVIEGTAQYLVPEGGNYAAFMSGISVSADELVQADTWAGLDPLVWNIAEGKTPSLRTPNQR